MKTKQEQIEELLVELRTELGVRILQAEKTDYHSETRWTAFIGDQILIAAAPWPNLVKALEDFDPKTVLEEKIKSFNTQLEAAKSELLKLSGD